MNLSLSSYFKIFDSWEYTKKGIIWWVFVKFDILYGQGIVNFFGGVDFVLLEGFLIV